jgi:serine protease inhibitor
MKDTVKKGFFVNLTDSFAKLISGRKRDTDVRPENLKTPEPDNSEITEPDNITARLYQKELTDSTNRFAFDLFRPILSDTRDAENIMISPFSISNVLSMILNGATGETFEVIRKSLGLEGKTLDQINSTYLKLMTKMVPADRRVVIEIANSAWLEKRYTMKQDFINALQKWYKAEARNIDVKNPHAVDIVNEWIANTTHNKITEILSELNPDFAMLLINAIYFNGKWKYPFNIVNTRQEPFYVTPSSPKTVFMMHQIHNLYSVKKDNILIVEIPYGRGNYAMVVVLPDENRPISDMASTLTLSLWEEWMKLLDDNLNMIDLSMPRFKYKYTRYLNDDLDDLGMGRAFTDKAEFSNISDQGVMVSKVLHQSFIDTNEKGTEAAAVTRGMAYGGGGPSIIIKATLDHPFLYFIRETSTDTILFMGGVSDPTSN